MKANTVPNFKVFLIFSMAQQPLVGQVLLIIEASRSHWIIQKRSVGLDWTSGQSDADTCTSQHSTVTRHTN